MTNFEKIKAMSVEEMADFICDIYADNEHGDIRIDGEWVFFENVTEYLESEVEEDG